MRMAVIGAGRIGAIHAHTVAGLAQVDSVVIADVDTAQAADIARAVHAESVATVDDVWRSGIDAVVIATPTDTHASLLRAAVAHRVPAFCEKPIAADLADTRRLVAEVEESGVPVQVGFQRRFDAGYTAVRSAVLGGHLGWLHTLRACTSDVAPPHAGYIPSSGGIFRDCSVHDFDAVRFVTGREVISVWATGANKGQPFFAAAGDVDTAAAILTLDDHTLVTCTATRYNGAGYDVRLEACGSRGTLVAGLDPHTPLTSATADDHQPREPYQGFLQRFAAAYVAELSAFADVVTAGAAVACTPADALEALLIAEAATVSRAEGRAVTLDEVRK
jgi:myo-inositol 2-dehydrogenase / D-chiro-inositol 1-dehydrogenase